MGTPNIVYILADDMGYGDLGSNNPESKIPTPHLDRLAGHGMRFTDAHAPSSLCTPSRYAILTGRYCWRSRLKEQIVWQWDSALIEPDRLTVAEFLRQQGYRTACFGKWHLGWYWQTLDGVPVGESVVYGAYDEPGRYKAGKNINFSKPMRGGPIDCGFDYYFGDDVPNFPPYTWFENDRLRDMPTRDKPPDMFGCPGPMVPDWNLEGVMPEITRRAVQYIDDVGDKPFFLYFPLTAPHEPIVPTEQFRGVSEAGLYGDYVVQVDWTVGQILAALDRNGIAENTLLIFTSDNGPEYPAYDRARDYRHYSMGNLRGIKRDTWEGGHRMPFIARWPSVVPAGTVCDQLVSLSDLLGTCADIAGKPLPDGQGEDSISILPLLLGETSSPVRDFAVHHSMTGRFAVRQREWVFIEAPTGDDNHHAGGEPDWFKLERGYLPHSEPGELFNLAGDASERVNLYSAHPEIVAQLTILLDQIRGVRADHAPRANNQGLASDITCAADGDELRQRTSE